LIKLILGQRAAAEKAANEGTKDDNEEAADRDRYLRI
jgi:hypothetical protein